MATKIFTQVTGDQITSRAITEEFTVDGKFETTISGLLNTDSPVALSVSHLGNVNKIILNSTSCNLNVTDGVGSYTIPIAGLFHWTVSSTYVATITSLTVDTDSVVAVDIDVTICGI